MTESDTPRLWFFNLCGNVTTSPDGSINLHQLATGLRRSDWKSKGVIYAVAGILPVVRTRSHIALLSLEDGNGIESELELREMGFDGEKFVGWVKFELRHGNLDPGSYWLHLSVDRRRIGSIPFVLWEDDW